MLAVDPSSTRSGGSILGDKTRMARLAADPNAFIRPSPTSGTLGGVAAKTRETMLLCEAAGFDVVLVETVGAGQSETAVADLTDFFLVLMLPGAGDALQGIKKGVLELADMIAVNKADGDNAPRALAAAAEYRAALHILTPASPTWSPPVVTVSGLANDGLDALWGKVLDASREADGQRRDRAQAPRPGREMDVGARRRAPARAARRRARPPRADAPDRAGGRQGRDVARRRRRRDRGASGAVMRGAVMRGPADYDPPEPSRRCQSRPMSSRMMTMIRITPTIPLGP